MYIYNICVINLHKWTYTIIAMNLKRQQADRLEQEAKGSLKRQKIMHEAEAEKARKELLELLVNY